jgi:hypothetical protein
MRLVPVASVVVRIVTAQPGIGVRKIRAAVRAAFGHCTDGDTDAAMFILGAALQRTIGTRGAHHYGIDSTKIPHDVLAHLAATEVSGSGGAVRSLDGPVTDRQ